MEIHQKLHLNYDHFCYALCGSHQLPVHRKGIMQIMRKSIYNACANVFQNFYSFLTPQVKDRSICFLTCSPKRLGEKFAKKWPIYDPCILHRITHNLHSRPVYRTLVGAAQWET
jgi:hypothetical protein